MYPVLFRIGPWPVPSHSVFVALGVMAGMIVVVREGRRRQIWGDHLLVMIAAGLVGGALGMRASGLLRDWDLTVSGEIWLVWQNGAKSILGGLTGAYFGVLIGKRLSGYQGRTGDVFAPAVALGMAIGRIGCFLTEPPGRATTWPWGIRLNAEQIAATPGCIGCRPGVAMHPSFLYEIAFQLVAFAVLLWLRPRIQVPGALFTFYVTGYAAFRFLVEFARDNQVVWVGMTRGQVYLLVVFPLLLWRTVVAVRANRMSGDRRARWMTRSVE